MKITIKEINEQVNTLIKTNQITEPAQLSYPNFTVNDLYPVMHQYFNQDAVNLLGKKTHAMLYQYNKHVNGSKYAEQTWMLAPLLKKLKLRFADDLNVSTYVRHVALVHCFGYTTTKDKVGQVALEVVKVINDLSSNKHALATLEPLMDIELADGRHCIVSYLAIDQQFESLVQSTYSHCMFKEGGLPPEF